MSKIIFLFLTLFSNLFAGYYIDLAPSSYPQLYGEYTGYKLTSYVSLTTCKDSSYIWKTNLNWVENPTGVFTSNFEYKGDTANHTTANCPNYPYIYPYSKVLFTVTFQLSCNLRIQGSDLCVDSCPSDTVEVNGYCVPNPCEPNQKLNTNISGLPDSGEPCEDICPPLDIYDPSSLSILDNLLPNNLLICSTPEDIDEPTCRANAPSGYKWVCDTSFVKKIVNYLLDLPAPAVECVCYNEDKTIPILFGTGSSSGLIPNLTRSPLWGKNPPLKALENLSQYERNNINNVIDYIDRNKPSLPLTKNGNPDLTKTNFDYVDTVIEIDPVTGGQIFVPVFNPTPVVTNALPVITNQAFSSTVTSAASSAIRNNMPNVPITNPTPELLQSAVQTATKTQFNLPTTNLTVGQNVVATANAVISATGKNVVSKSYPMTVESITPNANGGNDIVYTGDVSNTAFPNDGQKNRIVVSTNANGSYSANVSQSFPIQTENGTETFTNNYDYNVDGGGTASGGTSSSTITSSDGSVVSNPTAPVSGLNLGTTDEKLNELINFEPTITATPIDSALKNTVKKEGESLTFVDSLIENYKDVENTFDDMFLKLQSVPTVSTKTGSCTVHVPFNGNVISADLCMFFAPYSSFVSAFLIMIGTFFVIKFAIENLKD